MIDISKVVVSVDCMGGDNAPKCTIIAVLALIQEGRYSNIYFKLFGNKSLIEQELKHFSSNIYQDYIEIVDCKDVISDNEKPSVAIRKGKNSSMRKAIESVKDGEADCIVSSGNTGALMAISKILLRTLPGIDRPAIISLMPTQDSEFAMLDLGANVECSELNLVQFAIMGSAFVNSSVNIKNPRVAILNVGSEEIKGHEEVKKAYQILKENDIVDFIGFIEGNEIMSDKADVIVTDGFTGNIALKTAEGTANFITSSFKNAFKSSFFAKIGGMLAKNTLKKKLKNLDPRMHNGAMLVGLNGIVIKSHGSTDEIGFAKALEVGISIAKHKINTKINREIEKTNSLFVKLTTSN